MPLGGLIIGGAGLLLNAGEGIAQNAKANAIEKGLKKPVDVIPPEFYENREIARQMAEIGIPQQQYNNSANNINQNQAAGIAAAQNSNNPGGAITSIVRQGNQAKANLDAQDAAARANNERFFIGQNATLGARKDQQEQANVFDPYTRDFNREQAYRGAAGQNFNNAASGAQQLAGNFLNYTTNNPNMRTTGYGVDPITGVYTPSLAPITNPIIPLP